MYSDLHLSCTGNSATLTVTTGDPRYYGLWAEGNFMQEHESGEEWFEATNEDPSNIAADGFTVTRSGGSNGDGSYTWVYTVTRNSQ